MESESLTSPVIDMIFGLIKFVLNLAVNVSMQIISGIFRLIGRMVSTSIPAGVAGVKKISAHLDKQKEMKKAEEQQEKVRKTWDKSHGTARWMQEEDRVRMAEVAEKGKTATILGFDLTKNGQRYLGWDAQGHQLVVSPTRGGKGVSVVIPGLLTWTGSHLTIDVKGENYHVTSRRYREAGNVAVLDPFNIVGGTTQLNPLQGLSPETPDAYTLARDLAEWLVVPSGDQAAFFWENSARDMIVALILYVAWRSPNPDLVEVTNLVYASGAVLAGVVKDMQTVEAESLYDGNLARLGGGLSNTRDQMLSDILATAKASLGFIGISGVTKLLRGNTLNLDRIRHERTGIYLVMPPGQVDRCRGLLRMVVGATLRGAVNGYEQGGRIPMLMMLDEFAQLKKMEQILSGITWVGAYGIRMVFILQNLGQLTEHYQEAGGTFLANTAVKQAFGIADHDTAKQISEWLGDQTISIGNLSLQAGEDRNSGIGGGGINAGGSQSHSNTSGLSQTARKLLLPDEIRRMDPYEQLVFIQGQDPLKCFRVIYYRDPKYQDSFDDNPLVSNA